MDVLNEQSWKRRISTTLRTLISAGFFLSFAIGCDLCCGSSGDRKPSHQQEPPPQEQSSPSTGSEKGPPQSGIDPPMAEPSALDIPRPFTPNPDDPPLMKAPEKLIATCGAALPNPWGIPSKPTRKRDGSCGTCTARPARIPLCNPATKSSPLSSQLLDEHLDREISTAAELSASPTYCTRRGGTCACNNACGAALQLVGLARVTATLSLAPEGRSAPLDSILDSARGPSGGLTCTGDEASLCCPLAIKTSLPGAQAPSASPPMRVIATGIAKKYPAEFPWRDSGDDSKYEFQARSICRVP